MKRDVAQRLKREEEQRKIIQVAQKSALDQALVDSKKNFGDLLKFKSDDGVTTLDTQLLALFDSNKPAPPIEATEEDAPFAFGADTLAAYLARKV